MAPALDIIDQFKAILGTKGYIEDPRAMAPFLGDQRGRYTGASPLVCLPKTVVEVQSVVRLAARHRIPLVPQGGNTSMVGGSVPDASGDALIVNLMRLNTIRNIDPTAYTITVDAGVILQAVQEAAAQQDRLFPLSLAAEGTAQIGGNIATNAGGIQVLKYGPMRALVLGVEAVLANGSVLSDLAGLAKDNTGYDLTQLMIGSEGTLGIVTGAILRLFPAIRDQATAFVAVPDIDKALTLLTLAREKSGDTVTGFELIYRRALDLAVRHIDGNRDPLEHPSPWYVLIDLSSPDAGADLGRRLEALLEQALDDGLIADGAVAASLAQKRAFWQLRETISDAQKLEGASIKHDISVPLSRMSRFVAEALPAAEALIPGIRPVPFGHLGDGNLHFNFSCPLDMDPQAFLDQWETLNHNIHDIVMAHGGSISAEHGIGRLKRDELAQRKGATDLAVMRAIKQALDPENMMNPGVLL